MPKRKTSSVDTSLGGNLAFFRKIAGLTQQQVADKLNLNRSTYTKYETGASEPGIELLKKIADIFNVDVASLLYDEDNRPALFDSSSDAEQLSAEELNFISKYKSLSREDREEMNKLLNTLCE